MVKSPSSNCSRISLQKTSSKSAEARLLRANPASPPVPSSPDSSRGPLQPWETGPCPALRSWPHSHEHGAADEEEEVKTAVISKEGVPDTDDVRQQELLGQQQSQPAEGEELGLDVLLLLGRQRCGVGWWVAM